MLTILMALFAYLVILPAIVLVILNEEKVIRFEQALWIGIKKTVEDRRK